MRSSRFSTQVSSVVRRGAVAVAGQAIVSGLPRGRAAACAGLPLRVRPPRGPGHPCPARRGLRHSRRNLKRARPSMHPKASLLSALGITRRPCGVPPLLPANPFTIELEIERSRLAGPGCPGRSPARGARADPPAVPGEVIPSVCTLSEPAAPSSTAQALAMVRAGLGYLSSCDAAELGTSAAGGGADRAGAGRGAAHRGAGAAAGRVQRPAGASGRWAVRAGGLAAGRHPRHQRRRWCGGDVGPAAGRASADRRRAR